MKKVSCPDDCRICYYHNVKDDSQVMESLSADETKSYLVRWFQKMEQGLCTFHEDDRIATTHLPETDCGCKLAVCQWCFDTFKATNKLGFRFPIKETFSEFLAMKNDEPVKYPHVGLPRDLTSEELANFESKTE
jgi:hypothetical protein